MDVRSEAFDPKAALEAEDLYLPRRVQPLDNLEAARVLLPASHPDAIDPREVRRHQARRQGKSKQKSSEESRKVLQTKDPKPNPLDELVSSFQEGPFLLLRRLVETKSRVRVVVRRIDGVRGTCSGLLRSFDRHFNLLLIDAVEDYTCQEFAFVSSDGWKCTLQSKLESFFKVFNPDKVSSADQVAVKYRGKERELWKFLHQKYGVTERVVKALHEEQSDTSEKRAERMLLQFCGREVTLLRKLGIAQPSELEAVKDSTTEALHVESCIIHAEWIRQQSSKYPGRFFYLHTKSKRSQWDPPENVTFKTIKYLVQRKRYIGNALLRGDCVVSCGPLEGVSSQ